MGFFGRSVEEKIRRRFILSIDGGGMRGIIPSVILSHMAELLIEMGDARPLYAHFDMIAGTSSGALAAVALSLPTAGTSLPEENGEETPVFRTETRRKLFWKHTERTLQGWIERTADPASFTRLYREHGREIFPQKSVSMLFGPLFTDKYSAGTYEAFLKKLYGTKTMSDLLVPTVMVSYSADNGILYPITSWENGDFKLWEAARASSAAPLYFPPFRYRDGNGNEIFLIDGGVAANNPSLVAYAAARKLYPDAEEFSILSLSTGETAATHSTGVPLGGLTEWAGSLPRIFQSASLLHTDMAAKAIAGVEYTRIWSPVLRKRIRLDDTSPQSLDMLEEAGERMYEENRESIERFCRMIAEAETPDRVRLRKPTALPEPSQKASS